MVSFGFLAMAANIVVMSFTAGSDFNRPVRHLEPRCEGSRHQAPAIMTSPTTDIRDVTAASQSFYTSLQVLDDGTRMEGVWANTPYVTYVGPSDTFIIVAGARRNATGSRSTVNL